MFPQGRKFAFSIVDDTDVATLENIKPIYDFIRECGIRTTKTVWMKRSTIRSKNFFRSQTMEDPEYAEYMKTLCSQGFEIAFHGASMESSNRDVVANALDEFHENFGAYPRIHINHSENQDNLYWGPERFRSPLIRFFLKLKISKNYGKFDFFQGHDPQSAFFWGDLCYERISYVRNFCYDEINQLNLNRSMPYHNPMCPYVRYWFSALDAPEVESFNGLLCTKNLNRLEREGGVCIVATHFGKYFVRNGRINNETRRVLESIAERGGWYVPVSTLLDYLKSIGAGRTITDYELRRMEWSWLWYRLKSRKRDRKPVWA